MTAERIEAARTEWPLPVLLVSLMVVTGLVDAFCYLSLRHVLVANMTGNVVFLGFGLATNDRWITNARGSGARSRVSG